MIEKEVISITEFETSREAWDFMLSQQKVKKDSLFSIPYDRPSIVVETFKKSIEFDPNYQPPRVRVISDHLGEGVQGLQSMADGKKYDSKSSYYKALKEQGCEIVGNDAPRSARSEIKGDFVSAKEVAETIKQLGG